MDGAGRGAASSEVFDKAGELRARAIHGGPGDLPTCFLLHDAKNVRGTEPLVLIVMCNGRAGLAGIGGRNSPCIETGFSYSASTSSIVRMHCGFTSGTHHIFSRHGFKSWLSKSTRIVSRPTRRTSLRRTASWATTRTVQ